MSSTEQDVRKAIATPDQTNNPWPRRLDAWKKFSEKFHDRGQKIESRYEDERDANQMTSGTNMDQVGGKRVNLFYSNVTIIKESLYNSLPKPDVSRLHTGDWDNEPARVAATIIERGLTYEINCAKYFDAAVKSAILDRLVPGLGTLWVNFVGPEGGKPEHMTIDIVYWRDFLYEPRRSWEQVTWAGRKLHVPTEEAKKRWGDKLPAPDGTPTQKMTTIEEAMKADTVCVIQMWDKRNKKVLHMSEDGIVLDEADDVYQLSDFWPFPKPLIASPPTRYFLPLPDYYMAQDQYLEMDILYARINLIIEAIKVAGVYDASQPALQRMLGGTENKLVPVDNWAMFAEKGGTKGSIDWFPVETIATVLTHLTTTYSFIKTQLFEVTGMADIIRGSSNQYETLGAQQIKAQFASIRMNGFQRDVSEFVRDTLRIMSEVMCQLYSDNKLSQVCGQLPADDQPFVQPALTILRNDFALHYNVSIEADSLTQADWGLEQQQRLDYVQSLAQFLTSAVPAAEANPQLMPLLVQMIKFASVGFKGSAELEGTLDKILNQLSQTPPEEEQEPSPEEQKAQAEQAKLQQEFQFKQQEHAMKLEGMQAEQMHKQRMHEMDLEFKAAEHAMDLDYQSKQFQMRAEADAVKGAQQIALGEQKAKQAAEAKPSTTKKE